MMDARLQESSRARTSDAIILFNVAKTEPLLNISFSGVLATRETILGHFVYKISFRRYVPFVDRFGKITTIRSWVSPADHSAASLKITGWTGMHTPGYSDGFKSVIAALNRNPQELSFKDAFRFMAVS
ncbi:MAG: hypothetical protein ACKPKO_44945, partial [Candidatus Fonsibacter sp.]